MMDQAIANSVPRVNEKKSQLKGLSLEQLRAWCAEVAQPEFRGNQLFNWLYKQNVSDPALMANLPGDFKNILSDRATLSVGEIVNRSTSGYEATQKFLVRLNDGLNVETVSMLVAGRHTVCVSSQVGCNVGCSFCATATMGLLRNLSAGEIMEQLLLVQQERNAPATNVVFMGMGEPFLNYGNVLAAADLMHHPEALNLGSHRITISTAGIVPKIKRFSDEGHKYRLAISLNAADDSTRAKLMPPASTWKIKELISTASEYTNRSKRQVTFEYVLMSGINDSENDARNLVRLGNLLNCKVNLIPYNVTGAKFTRPANSEIDRFASYLSDAKFTVTVRWSNGVDISAGCGQLAIKP